MLTSYTCPSCHGTGLAVPTYAEVWDSCQDCEGAGEMFEDEDNG